MLRRCYWSASDQKIWQAHKAKHTKMPQPLEIQPKNTSRTIVLHMEKTEKNPVCV